MPHSFIVVSSHTATLCSLAGRWHFLSLMLTIFVNAKTPPIFFALLLLLVQVEKSFKEPLATQFAAWPKALNGTNTHKSGIET